MRVTDIKIAVMAVVMVSLFALPGYSQENANTEAPAPTAPEASPGPDQSSQVKEIAIYGEVQSVDTAKGVLAVQYYDYDSDSEKTSEVVIDSTTKMENAATLADVKKGDWVDVTYTVKDGIKAARVVTVEKEELPATEEAATKAVDTAVNLPAEQ